MAVTESHADPEGKEETSKSGGAVQRQQPHQG